MSWKHLLRCSCLGLCRPQIPCAVCACSMLRIVPSHLEKLRYVLLNFLKWRLLLGSQRIIVWSEWDGASEVCALSLVPLSARGICSPVTGIVCFDLACYLVKAMFSKLSLLKNAQQDFLNLYLSKHLVLGARCTTGRVHDCLRGNSAESVSMETPLHEIGLMMLFAWSSRLAVSIQSRSELSFGSGQSSVGRFYNSSTHSSNNRTASVLCCTKQAFLMC